MITILNVYESEIKIKGILCFLTVYIYRILVLTYKPFKEYHMNSIDKVQTDACSITIILGVFLY